MAESSSSAATTAASAPALNLGAMVTGKKIVLEGSQITDKVIAGIESLPNYNNIVSMTFAGTNLFHLPKLPESLQNLKVNDNPNLKSLPSLPRSLNYLFVLRNPNITRLPSPLPEDLFGLDTRGTPIRTLPLLPNSLAAPDFSPEFLIEPFQSFVVKYMTDIEKRAGRPFHGAPPEVAILRDQIREHYKRIAIAHPLSKIPRQQIYQTANKLAQVQSLMLMKSRNTSVNEETGKSKAVTLPYGVEYDMAEMLGAPMERVERIYQILKFTRPELMEMFQIPEPSDRVKPFELDLEILKNLYYLYSDSEAPPRRARYSGFLNYGGARSRKISASRRMPSQTRRRRAQRNRRRNRSMKGGGDYDYCSDLRKKNCPGRTNGGKHMFERVESAKMLPKMKCKYCGDTCLA